MRAHNKIGETAARDYLLTGEPLTVLEASVLFGMSYLHQMIDRLKKAGFRIEKRKITYALAIRRINEHTSLVPPQDLPIREIFFTEYRIQQ